MEAVGEKSKAGAAAQKINEPVLPWMRKPIDASLLDSCPLSLLPMLDPRYFFFVFLPKDKLVRYFSLIFNLYWRHCIPFD